MIHRGFFVFQWKDEHLLHKKYGFEVAQNQTLVLSQTAMAGATNEKMLASYSYLELKKLLTDSNFLIYEHLTPNEITEQYFKKYNQSNPEHTITAFDNVNYCFATKK